MKVDFLDDYMLVVRDIMPEGFCSSLIGEIERYFSYGIGHNRKQERFPYEAHLKDDFSMSFRPGFLAELNLKGIPVKKFNDEKYYDEVLFEGLQAVYDIYTNKYSVLKEQKIMCNTLKMQRTSPGGGYHIWHAEHGPDLHSNRVLVYSLYLNTLGPEAGGETEFLYQKKRVAAEENKLVIWPASYTHAHRGNPVLGDKDKYIVTGWFCYDF